MCSRALNSLNLGPVNSLFKIKGTVVFQKIYSREIRRLGMLDVSYCFPLFKDNEKKYLEKILLDCRSLARECNFKKEIFG